jgi:N-acetylmuramoyl-L-alanine amidase
LEKQGANVFMTRTEDTYFSLNERLLMSRRILPDLFISIHADSYIETSDLNKVKGFSVFYKDELSKGISDLVLKNVVSKLNRKDRGSNYKNLYMVRGTWSEHILFEMGFMSNPEDFEWMNDMGEKQAFVDNVVNSIIEYYKK